MVRALLARDVYLLLGIAVALFVVFSRDLGDLLDQAHQLDQERNLQLLPAAVILTAVFIFHLLRRRQKMRVETQQATARAEEMGRLVAFGQALSRSLDGTTIRAAVAEHLPRLAPGREAWTLIRMNTYWEPLTPDSGGEAREEAAARALEAGGHTVRIDGAYACFPMVVGETPLGVLGISADPPPAEHEQRLFETAAALLSVSIKNAELFREVHDNSVRDALTGCFNRKHTLEMLDVELRRSRRSHLPLSVIIFDLDHFKQVNDRSGHLCGDAVLAQVGERMRAVLRSSDIKCRYGGEEFVVVLPDTPLGGARRVAENLRRDIESHPVPWQDTVVPVTASFGIATAASDDLEVHGILARADAALYRAKQEGRNAIRDAHEPAPV
jgi:diguanylate cyclase (GGDEF)-like protein